MAAGALATSMSVLAATPAYAAGGDIYVDCTSGSNSNAGTSWGQAFQTLNKAITEANGNTGEDTIHIAKGTCSVSTTTTITDDLIVEGAANNTDPGTGTVLNLDASVTAFNVDGSSDPASLTVRDLVIDGQSTNDTQGVHFGTNSGSTESLTVTDVTVKDAGNGTHDYGIYAALWSSSKASIDIEDSTVTDSGNEGILVHADDDSDGTVTVSGNIVTNAGSDGIYFDAKGATDFTVDDNTVTKSKSHGINVFELSGTATVSATGNTASENGTDGIHIREMGADSALTLDGNTANKNDRNGIQVYGSGKQIKGTVTLTDNTTNKNYYDIRIDPSGSADVTMSGNTATGSTGLGGIRIYANDSATVTATGATVKDNDWAGINGTALDSAHVTITGVTATGNDVGVYSATFDGADAAVDIKDATVTGNDTGIQLYPDTGSIDISDSTVTDSTAGPGISIRPHGETADPIETGTVTIDSTLIKGNAASGIVDNVDGPVELTVSKSTVTDNGTGVELGRDGLTVANHLVPDSDGAAQVHVVDSTFSNHPNGSQINIPGGWATDVDVAFSTLTADGAPGVAALRIQRPEGEAPGDLSPVSVAVTHSILDNGAEDPAIESVGLGDGLASTLSVDYSLARHVNSGSGAEGVLNVGTGNILNEDPQLGSLADNGGATHTYLPAWSSPVVDAGLEQAAYNTTFAGTFGSAPSTDQRLAPRFGSPADFGAVELARQMVTPEAPLVTQPVCTDDGTVSDPSVEVTPVDGVTYTFLVNGETASDLSGVQPGDTVKIRAQVEGQNPGLVLEADNGWEQGDGALVYTVTLDDLDCSVTAGGPTDEGTTEELATTGSSVSPWAPGLAALLLMGAGAGLVLARRRRES